jgi:transcriptional regulator
MFNNEIKEAIRTAGLKQWEVADRYKLSEGNFSRMLRRALSSEKKERILTIISELTSENDGVQK